MIPLTIIGGGLAGLSLGIALRNRNVNVDLFEADDFPRHRVCGEFISGIQSDTLKSLGVDECINDSHYLNKTVWYYKNEKVLKANLPYPALGISRYLLDERLANTFTDLGGNLHTKHRFKNKDQKKPLIWASGRQAKSSSWIGLKLHCKAFPIEGDLNLHIGENGYAGASPVENNKLNICGLFKIRPAINVKKENIFIEYLKACGIESLAKKVSDSEIDTNSITSVAALNYKKSAHDNMTLNIGDRFSLIPPFTGNGMSMAFEAASLAVDPLNQYSNKELSWQNTIKLINEKQKNMFQNRLRVANFIHPWIYQPQLQKILVTLSKFNMVPFKSLFHLMH